ncbi:MAG: DUF86 domain-containing protein [Synechococcus sp. LacPavin_0920_WC12_MAG_50_7]|nr:DUF86 domain-containing protein [Synechococcus sp. LacPavin_0920_WC12_MAG_50_7]
MSNEKQFSQDLLEQILNLVESVINRMAEVGSADDLVLTEQGKLLLDAVCMQYLALGETIKQLDKHTQGELLTRHPSQDWKGIMGFRDVLAHQYFSVDPAQVLWISRQAMPQLRLEILLMIQQLNN